MDEEMPRLKKIYAMLVVKSYEGTSKVFNVIMQLAHF